MSAVRVKSAPVRPEPGELLAAEVADRLGLTAQAIGKWLERPDAPARKVGARSFVRWPAFARWREQELKRQAADEATAAIRKQLDAVQGGDPLGRKLKAEARRAEIEVELLEGSVVRVEDVVREFSAVLTNLRAALMAIPRVWAAKLLGAKSIVELESRLHDETRRVMDTLAAPMFGKSKAGDAPDTPHEETT